MIYFTDCNIASEPKKPAAAPPVGLKRYFCNYQIIDYYERKWSIIPLMSAK